MKIKISDLSAKLEKNEELKTISEKESRKIAGGYGPRGGGGKRSNTCHGSGGMAMLM